MSSLTKCLIWRERLPVWLGAEIYHGENMLFGNTTSYANGGSKWFTGILIGIYFFLQLYTCLGVYFLTETPLNTQGCKCTYKLTATEAVNSAQECHLRAARAGFAVVGGDDGDVIDLSHPVWWSHPSPSLTHCRPRPAHVLELQLHALTITYRRILAGITWDPWYCVSY